MGRSGLQLSALSFGSWVTFDTQLDDVARARLHGRPRATPDATSSTTPRRMPVARARTIMGQALARTRMGRASPTCCPPSSSGACTVIARRTCSYTLNRKYLTQASTARWSGASIDFLDLIYCHRADPNTPIEETVWAMSDIVSVRQGAVLGHERVVGRRHPWCVGDRRASSSAQAGHRAEPVQPARAPQGRAVEYARINEDFGFGTTIWSPLASAACSPASTNDGIPEGSRAPSPDYAAGQTAHRRRGIDRVERLRPIAERLGCTMAQLAMAWCTANPNVSTVITGASRVEPGRLELRDPRPLDPS